MGMDVTTNYHLNLHLKILKAPVRYSLDEMIDKMKSIYSAIGITIEIKSIEKINLPELENIDIGNCDVGITTSEQDQLFDIRNSEVTREIVAYFIDNTNPIMNGCSSHKSEKPGCIISSIGGIWTLSHELGHVCGLEHVSDRNRLMYGKGTDRITNPPPDLVQQEIDILKNSIYTIKLT